MSSEHTSLAQPNPALERWRAVLSQPSAPAPWWQRIVSSAPAAAPRSRPARRTALPGAYPVSAPVLEACRLLLANLALESDPPPPLVVIAPAAEPACAMVAAGLASAMAESGRTTLLVDADMRSPLLHTLFGLAAGPGFAEALAEGDATRAAPSEVAPCLRVLPAGTPRFSPALIFRRQRASQVLDGFSSQYESVVYHMAGNWTTPELLAFAPCVGAAVLTVRAGIETAEHIRRLKQPLERAGVRLLGFTLIGGAE